MAQNQKSDDSDGVTPPITLLPGARLPMPSKRTSVFFVVLGGIGIGFAIAAIGYLAFGIHNHSIKINFPSSSSPYQPPIIETVHPDAPTVVEDYSVKIDKRFRSLATIEANTLERLATSEAEVAELRSKLAAAAKEQEDMSLRLEMLTRDFHRIPDTETHLFMPKSRDPEFPRE